MAKREDILISRQLEIITDKIDYVLDHDIKQLLYTKSHKMKKDSQGIIKDAPRVDTGRMWKTIKSFVTVSDSKLGITLLSRAALKGKESYSSFQEAGTSRISGIFFIRDSFNNNLKNIESEINNLITRAVL